jgi:hypothetical protein
MAIFRNWRANRYPNGLLAAVRDLPAIDLLIVAAGKDLQLLPFAISSAVAKSLNPIIKIVVVIPNAEQEECKKILTSHSLPQEVQILLEDDVINEIIRQKLKVKFKNRYGWVLQQLLALQYVLNSQSKAVLLLDADTILVREVAWLDSNNRQVMMVSFDYHKAYYQVLNKLIGSKVKPKEIFVAHHMLLQPGYLKEIFLKFQIIDIDTLCELLINYANEKDESSLCVDFELYGQGMMMIHREKLELRKFGNTPVERSEFKTLEKLYKDYENYNSVSLHSYLKPRS